MRATICRVPDRRNRQAVYGNNIATTFILTFYLFIYFYFYMRIALVGLSPHVRGCTFYYLYELASMKTTENSSPLSPRLSLKCVLRLRCVCVAISYCVL